jgi:hypothetical protein
MSEFFQSVPPTTLPPGLFWLCVGILIGGLSAVLHSLVTETPRRGRSRDLDRHDRRDGR